MENGGKAPGAHVVVMELPMDQVRALLHIPHTNNEPAVFVEAADAELCAADWRKRLPHARIRVIPCLFATVAA